MKIFVKAKSNAREEKVEKIDDNHYKVCVKASPINGKANQAVMRVLADYFKVTLFQVNIVAGHTSKEKIVEIS